MHSRVGLALPTGIVFIFGLMQVSTGLANAATNPGFLGTQLRGTGESVVLGTNGDHVVTVGPQIEFPQGAGGLWCCNGIDVSDNQILFDFSLNASFADTGQFNGFVFRDPSNSIASISNVTLHPFTTVTPTRLSFDVDEILVDMDGIRPSSSDLILLDVSFVPDSILTTLVSFGSQWKYLDNGTNQTTAWRDPAFQDELWSDGAAQLGYGDSDETTVVNCGPNAPSCRASNHATTFFRQAFRVNDASMALSLSVDLLRDDAAAVYLNGVEVYRDENLPVSAAYNTYATSVGPENGVTTFGIDPSLLTDGENVLAVEVHQASPTSSDVSFDLQLRASVIPVPEPSTLTLAALALFGCAATRRRSGGSRKGRD